MRSILYFIFFVITLNQAFAQVIPAGFPILEEQTRRKQLNDELERNYSFLLRPVIKVPKVYDYSFFLPNKVQSLTLGLFPISSTYRFTSDRPYGWNDYGMIPNPGHQIYLSTGIEAKFKFIHLTLKPEFVFAENLGYKTFWSNLTYDQVKKRALFWAYSDTPERFGDGNLSKIWWGQSKLTFQYGSFEIGGSTQNIWWGPGQFNALTFSNNAQGFPHLTLNTTKPAKTFLGNIETQLLLGELKNSGFVPTQNQAINEIYFSTPFSDDWRYLNAITFTWNPKWIRGFFFGFSRTFQQYNANRGNSLYDWLPVLEGFQKKNFFSNGNSLGFDNNGRDQTITLFGRLLIFKSKSEIYFEFGRRDHAFTWREYLLNPEHARAFLLGFSQLIDLPSSPKQIQIRGEITHQQESINRILRYGPEGGLTWHTHTRARGFVNFGQPLGVGIGTGSNVQAVEVSLVEGISKQGIVFERLANNQDFYYKAQLQSTQRKPWIDLSLGFLYDKQFNNLLLSSKLQVIHAKNYQWQLDPASTPEFPKGKNLTSVMAQVSAIYFWNEK